MPKKKLLPDQSKRPILITNYYGDGGAMISQEILDNLAEKHSFDPDFDLLKPLDEVLHTYETDCLTKSKRLGFSAQKEFLKKTAARAADLHEALTSMGTETSWPIRQTWMKKHAPTGWKNRMTEDCQSLKSAAEEALIKVQEQDYTSKDFAYWELLESLIETYTLGTKKEPTLSRNPSKGKAYGEMGVLSFTKECLSIVGVNKSTKTLGKNIEKLIY